MQPFVTTNLLAIVLLAALIASGSLGVLRSLFIVYARRSNLVIYRINGDIKSVRDVLKLVAPPFSFEIAVSQLGKEKSYYITIPSGRSRKLAEIAGAEKIDDYEVYHPGGVIVGGYAFGESPLNLPEVGKFNFSEINEIGEGAILQIVAYKKKRGALVGNLRALVSAPSQFQAKEIFTNIKKSMPDVQFREMKSNEFVDLINNRKFLSKESVAIKL